MELLTTKFKNKIKGILSCYDRVILQGTIPGICYAEGMTAYLYAKQIRIFDFYENAKQWRNQIILNVEKIAIKNGLKIEYIRKKNFRKETKIKKILKKRGYHPGLVYIFSAVESCYTFKPWYDKKNKKAFLISTPSKCLHYYFYFIDQKLGLCYMRVPTWAPFRLQFYFNGHNLLASKLRKKRIKFQLIDNAFVYISNFIKAQNLANNFSVEEIHKKLDKYAKKLCPIIKHFNQYYHWSNMQTEYAMDIVFKQQKDLKPIYEEIIRTMIHTVKPENIATFLGRKLHGNYQDEMGNDFKTRINGTRILHKMGKSWIKMYDKFGLILRIEVTSYNISFFKHFRKVEHRDGSSSMKFAPFKKSIYSLKPLLGIFNACNKRYLEFISCIQDNTAGIKKLNKISEPAKENNRKYKGLNLFNNDDLIILQSLLAGEYNISGFQNKNLREKIPQKNMGQISRILKRLRIHGIIKKIRNTYKYYLTKFGKQVISLGLKLKELYIIPALT